MWFGSKSERQYALHCAICLLSNLNYAFIAHRFKLLTKANSNLRLHRPFASYQTSRLIVGCFICRSGGSSAKMTPLFRLLRLSLRHVSLPFVAFSQGMTLLCLPLCRLLFRLLRRFFEEITTLCLPLCRLLLCSVGRQKR
jgi:hypothetical protein